MQLTNLLILNDLSVTIRHVSLIGVDYFSNVDRNFWPSLGFTL